MRVTQEQLKSMLPGQILIAKCVNAAEWDSAKRIAQKVKKEFVREDDNYYIVSQSAPALTVTVETTNIPQP